MLWQNNTIKWNKKCLPKNTFFNFFFSERKISVTQLSSTYVLNIMRVRLKFKSLKITQFNIQWSNIKQGHWNNQHYEVSHQKINYNIFILKFISLISYCCFKVLWRPYIVIVVNVIIRIIRSFQFFKAS